MPYKSTIGQDAIHDVFVSRNEIPFEWRVSRHSFDDLSRFVILNFVFTGDR